MRYWELLVVCGRHCVNPEQVVEDLKADDFYPETQEQLDEYIASKY